MATAPVMTITPPYTPELLEPAQARVAARLAQPPGQRVLELGSGWSTIWLAGLAATVSLEHDLDWFEEVERVLALANLSADHRLLDPGDFPETIIFFPDDSFDLVYIDCVDEQRLPCLWTALPKLKTGGWLVIDDTHWPMFVDIAEVLAPRGMCLLETFSGEHTRKDGTIRSHETSIYIKARNNS